MWSSVSHGWLRTPLRTWPAGQRRRLRRPPCGLARRAFGSAEGRRAEDVAARLARMEETLAAMQAALEQNRRSIDRNYEAYHSTKRIWKPETVERLHASLVDFEGRLGQLGELRVRGMPVFTRWTAGVLAVVLLGAFLARSLIYRRIADETAVLGKEVLDQNMQNIVGTIKAVSKDPETLAALVSLLTQLIQDETTRKQLLALVLYLVQDESTLKALQGLLMDLFKDEALTQRTGEFLLHALDTETTRRMLNEQVQALASATVLDRKVQQDAGTGARRALQHALWPL
mmetsp:Transcript_11667/g.37079  ORF Transcript_11667/g.37079 Transcript_11667/m.37079 type:complete len:287 (-) Transcript_11667:105-965(-)